MTNPAKKDYPRAILKAKARMGDDLCGQHARTKPGECWGRPLAPNKTLYMTGRVSIAGDEVCYEGRLFLKGGQGKLGRRWFIPARLLDVLDSDIKSRRW